MKPMEIVLVHLRTKPPRHLKANLSHLVRSFPQYGVTLVTDLPRSSVDLPEGVSLFNVPKNGAFQEIMASSSLNDHFCGGFWPLTLARLGGLVDWHRENEGASFLHLESDMLLFEYAPINSIAALEELAWLSCSPEADLAGFIFSPSREHSERLLVEVLHEMSLDSQVTDMQILYRIRARVSGFAGILPGVPELVAGWKNSQEPQEVSFEGGLFDSLSLGMWITGEDPRNSFGFIRYLRPYPESFFLFNPGMHKFLIEGNKLFVLIHEARRLVFSLHVHSKDLRLFDITKRESVIASVLARQHDGAFRRFSFYGFSRVFLDYFRAGLRRVGGIFTWK